MWKNHKTHKNGQKKGTGTFWIPERGLAFLKFKQLEQLNK